MKSKNAKDSFANGEVRHGVKRGARNGVVLHRLVCARHGRVVIGLKSRVS